jgi:hypothetical protein
MYRMKVATPDAIRLFEAANQAGGKARVWETKPGVTVTRLPQQRITELAADAGIAITELRPQGEFGNWMGTRILDPVAWRTRAYFALKLPLTAAGLAVIAASWLGGLFFATFPAWWALGLGSGSRHGGTLSTLPGSFSLVPLGGVLLIAAPGLTHGLAETDRWLMRGLLGPASPAERMRERDVLALMAEGRSNSAIAERFFVSERAVERHISNIFSKLGLPPSDSDHRRVLAVLAFLNDR